MTIDHVVDGETELDSALFNPWVDHMNGLQTGAIPIALAGIEGALGARDGSVTIEGRGGDATGASSSLAAFTSAAADSDTIIVPPGTWFLPGGFAPTNSVLRLIGAGSGRTTIISESNPSAPLIAPTNADSLQISGVTLISQGVPAGSGHGLSVQYAAQSVVLDDVVIDGFVAPLYLDGSTGGAAQNEVYALRIGGNPTGGTYIVRIWRYGAGDLGSTSAIAHNASAATIQSALEAVLGSGNVSVSGATPTYTVTLQGALAGHRLPSPPLVDYSGLTGGTTPTASFWRTTEGGYPSIGECLLNDVHVRNGGTFGADFNCIEHLSLTNCSARLNYLDGLKMRRNIRHFSIVGGHFDDNGTAIYRTSGTTSLGDGLDCYAGAESGYIAGATFLRNSQNGIQIKNDDGEEEVVGFANLSGTGPDNWGIARKLDIAGVQCSGSKVGAGLAITHIEGDNDYSVSDVTVSGGQFEHNASYGISLIGRRISLLSPRCRRNGSAGIFVHQDASEISIVEPVAIANGTGVETGVGINISGSHVHVRGGRVYGVDIEDIREDTVLSTLTRYHGSNIWVGNGATDVVIDRPDDRYGPSAGRSIYAHSSTSRVLIHQRQESGLTPGSSLIYGSIGSTYEKATGETYIKLTGVVDAVGTWGQLGT